jgi:hypothetical protein
MTSIWMAILVLAVGGDAYFVSNQADRFVQQECSFRVSGKKPELWHPDTGKIEPAAAYAVKAGRVIVPLAFDPSGSVFVVFREPDATTDHVVTPQQRLVAVGEPIAVEGNWTLSFPPNWGAPASVALDRLISWSEHADSGVKYFSGTATYEKELQIPAEALVKSGGVLWLDLGVVKNLAKVKVNGEELGILWKRPFRVDIAPAARVGGNRLEIQVTNQWPNRLIGDEQLPEDIGWWGTFDKRTGQGVDWSKPWPQWLMEGKPSPTGRLTFSPWRHYTKDSPLLPSGLLGPVTLQPAENLPRK